MKYRNVSGRVVAGVKPGGTIKQFPEGCNVRALELAGVIAAVPDPPPKKKETKPDKSGKGDK